MNHRPLLFAVAALFILSPVASSQVTVGSDILFGKKFDLIRGKRIGLVTNHTGVLSDGRHLADALHERTDVKLVALFGPEHGIRGDAPAGAKIQHGVDQKTGVTAYSLYGKDYKPTGEMMKDVDVLMYDIQDVGARFYTYISTLSYAMEAAAEKGIPFIVLDRPNPIRGTWVEGFVREDSLRSFVGLHPIPVAHGMTVGELATMYNEEGWLKDGIKAKLIVVKMEGWNRDMWYDKTGLAWRRPSPNIPTTASAVVYPGTCFIEGTNLSEGRGTDKPFEYIGAPFVDGARLAAELNAKELPGVRFDAVRFTPKEIPYVVANPKHKGIECGGIEVVVTDRNRYEPVKTGIFILAAAKRLFEKDFQWRGSIERLTGTVRVRQQINEGVPPESIVAQWKPEVDKFSPIRARYLLY